MTRSPSRERVLPRAFFAAVRDGDLAVVSRYFGQQDVRARIHETAAAEDLWFDGVMHGDFVFATIVRRGHVELLDWFFSQSMFSRAMCSLLARVGLTILEQWTPQAREMMEIVLSSRQFTEQLTDQQRYSALAELLSAASANGRNEWLEPLLAHGADTNLSYAYVTPLFAATGGDAYTIRCLAANGALVTQSDLVTQAVFESNRRVVRELLRLGADCRSPTLEHPSVLLLAADMRLVRIFKLLLVDGIVDIDSRDSQGRTPLMVVAFDEQENGHEFGVQLATELLELGADLHATDATGMTALHWATHNDDVALYRLLLERGADPNVQNQGGFTPLSELAECGVTEPTEKMMDLLLQCGADPFLTPNNGESVAWLLRRKPEGRRYLAKRSQFFRQSS